MLLVAVLAGCKSKPSIATLEKADGPVERQEADRPWGGAKIGTKYYLGDAARTADGGAQLALAGQARIAMQPHTVLRFGAGKSGSAQIGVELGAIDLQGAGDYKLDVGDVQIKENGAIRVTAPPGTPTLPCCAAGTVAWPVPSSRPNTRSSVIVIREPPARSSVV
ncbi:MAG: hypothetical protein JF590_01660, partial [Gemmatimonadetes bacterium]|nr:hypothetical protein [Gemmatimonadota bacterium]